MKPWVWQMCVVLLILETCYMYGVHNKFSGYRKDITAYSRWLWSILAKPLLLGSFVSWLCWNLVYLDSVKPSVDPKPVSPASFMNRKALPPYYTSLNFYAALSLGPLVALALLW